jgi:predicted ABC-type ATPase
MGSSLLTDQDHSPARARRAASSSPQAGHDIPEAKIRERWENSRLNIIRLLPHLAEFVLWDNSAEAGGTAAPVLLLHVSVWPETHYRWRAR